MKVVKCVILAALSDLGPRRRTPAFCCCWVVFLLNLIPSLKHMRFPHMKTLRQFSYSRTELKTKVRQTRGCVLAPSPQNLTIITVNTGYKLQLSLMLILSRNLYTYLESWNFINKLKCLDWNSNSFPSSFGGFKSKGVILKTCFLRNGTCTRSLYNGIIRNIHTPAHLSDYPICQSCHRRALNYIITQTEVKRFSYCLRYTSGPMNERRREGCRISNNKKITLYKCSELKSISECTCIYIFKKPCVRTHTHPYLPIHPSCIYTYIYI